MLLKTKNMLESVPLQAAIALGHRSLVRNSVKYLETVNHFRKTFYFRWDQVKIFKGCLPQILIGPLLNTLSQMFDWVFNTPLNQVSERDPDWADVYA